MRLWWLLLFVALAQQCDGELVACCTDNTCYDCDCSICKAVQGHLIYNSTCSEAVCPSSAASVTVNSYQAPTSSAAELGSCCIQCYCNPNFCHAQDLTQIINQTVIPQVSGCYAFECPAANSPGQIISIEFDAEANTFQGFNNAFCDGGGQGETKNTTECDVVANAVITVQDGFCPTVEYSDCSYDTAQASEMDFSDSSVGAASSAESMSRANSVDSSVGESLSGSASVTQSEQATSVGESSSGTSTLLTQSGQATSSDDSAATTTLTLSSQATVGSDSSATLSTGAESTSTVLSSESTVETSTTESTAASSSCPPCPTESCPPCPSESCPPPEPCPPTPCPPEQDNLINALGALSLIELLVIALIVCRPQPRYYYHDHDM